MNSPAADALAARRFARLIQVLVCPACAGELVFNAQSARCGECAISYPIRDGRVYFIATPDRDDQLDTVKGRLKQWFGQAYYTVGIHLLAPTFPISFRRTILRYVDPAQALVLDAGSGNHRLHPDMICADFFDYDAVDVVCSLDRLPFRADALAAVVSRSVLEHVAAPEQVVREFWRCTQPGGVNIHMIPFMFPFHASPADYQRYTHRGHDQLFKEWEPVSRTNPTGPVSVLLLVVIETLAILLSFGSLRVKSWLYLALCGLLFPLKFLDAPFVNRPSFMTVAASILSVVRKPQ